VHNESLAGKEIPGYTVETLQIDSNKYGYEIKQDERVVIMQPFVPCMPGKMYFESPEDAIQVGTLVAERLEAGVNFSITMDDMKKLGITSFTK